jgi:PKD repeat protein
VPPWIDDESSGAMQIRNTVVGVARGGAALLECVLLALMTAGPAAAAGAAPGVVGYEPMHAAVMPAPFAPVFGAARVGPAASAAPTPHVSSDSGPVVYNGGPVMASNANELVVWMPSNDTAPAGMLSNEFQTGYIPGIEQYFTDIAAASGKGGFNDSVTAQYNDLTAASAGGTSTFGGELIDTDPLPAEGCASATLCLTDAQIESELTAFLSGQNQPAGLAHQYFLLTPPNVASCIDAAGTDCSANATTGNSFCAYHGYTGGASGYVYANIPDLVGLAGCDPFHTTGAGDSDPTGSTPPVCTSTGCPYPNGPADGVLASIANTHNEATTDAEPNTGWTLECSGGIPCGIVNPCAFDELADPGNQLTSGGAPYNMTINGSRYWLSPLYSNQTTTGTMNSGHCVDSWTPNGSAATASFTVTPQAGDSVSFNAGGSTGTGSDVLLYEWEFNDGPGDTQTSYVETLNPTVTHTFPGDGTYTVALTVFLRDETSNGTAEQVTASSAPPAAPTVTGLSPSFGPAAGGSTVTITGTNLSTVTDVKFGSKLATRFVKVSPTQVTADSPPGAGTVDVTVTTAGGTSATSPADSFVYAPPPPTASFTVSSGPKVGSPVAFDASGSKDPNAGGSITGESWDFGDGTAVATGATVTHTFAVAGTYAVTLTVTDHENGTASTSQTVNVTATGTTGTTGIPMNTGAPSISGRPVIDGQLTATSGTWTNTPTSFADQWLDCKRNSHGREPCHAIPGATGAHYVILAGQVAVGDTVRIEVTATNAAGTGAAARSAATAAVAAAPPQVTVGPPAVKGPTATVPLGCAPGQFILVCYLSLNLSSLTGSTLRPPPPPGSARDASVRAARARHTKTIVVGRAKVTIKPGHHKTARIALNAAGRRLLARRGRLMVTLTVSQLAHRPVIRTITFTAHHR